ncbi:MAG: hypothetical protein AB1635_13405 [Acidobacteriota bacterium]
MDASAEGIVFAFLPNQKVPKGQCEDARTWLEGLAEQIAGVRVPVRVIVVDEAAAQPAPAPGPAAPSPAASKADLEKEALADPSVQALLEIFPVEKTKVEEI